MEQLKIKKTTQIIRDAAKARFRRTLRAGLADARTAPYRKFGFTLAETLITLGVIGIVAAFMIPNLVQTYKKKVYSTRIKYFYSMMSQAIKLSEIDNGPIETWVKNPMAKDEEGNDDYAAQLTLVKNYFYKYLAPYIKYESVEDVFSNAIIVSLGNGSKFVMYNGSCIDMTLLTDNAKISDNSDVFRDGIAKDKFQFNICPSNYTFLVYPETDKRLATYCDHCTGLTREELLDKCKTFAQNCGALLMYDNWEFKDDYPYKL